MRNTPRASLVAQDGGVEGAHAHPLCRSGPAASTTTPLMAPTPVVSCAAASVATSASTTAMSAGTGRLLRHRATIPNGSPAAAEAAAPQATSASVSTNGHWRSVE